MAATIGLAKQVGAKRACEGLGIPRASFYRHLAPVHGPRRKRPKPVRALTTGEREAVLAHFHSERFQDQSPVEVAAALLDEGRYHCSARTMHRLLAEAGQSRERRNQLVHPPYQKHELLATAPNQLWTYFYLYIVLDVFSRYVVGWMIAHRESATLAEKLFADICRKQRIEPGQLTVHADRGSSMTSKPVAFLLSDLGVTKTHSRPHVSNDNPYSESQFRTMKYRPAFLARFGSIQDARAFAVNFFDWYNERHHHSHSGISLLTPSALHHGQAPAILAQRQTVLESAYLAHPERFVNKPPKSHQVPSEVWINKPPSPEQTTP